MVTNVINSRKQRWPAVGVSLACTWFSIAEPIAAEAWRFTEVSVAAGLDYSHGYVGGAQSEPAMIAGGVAAGDYDGDTWVDLYIVRGTLGPNLLFRNRGDGSFEEVGAAAGVAIPAEPGAGPAFADLDGDGDLDLVVGGVLAADFHVFQNRGDGTFADVTGSSGLASDRENFSAAFADFDRDGDLDLFWSHWGRPGAYGHLWANDGHGHFTDVGAAQGVSGAFALEDYSFTPNFADLDGDGWPDLLVAGDFGTSRVFRNLGGSGFVETTSPVISDENGMGAAIGDFDNDLDLDWFVSSIWDPDGVPEGNWGVTGNRLYANQGDGTWLDATDVAGVRQGYWGWGACFGDFDNDGDLDLFHGNGMPMPGADEFFFDPARLFVNRGDGTFDERAATLGVDDTGQGRGVVCFDYDRDGDLDLFIANNSGRPRLYRNELATGHSFVLRLVGRGGNSEAVGARVELVANGHAQLREVRVGSNFVSQDPATLHFGLGAATVVEELRIRWPDGEQHVVRNLPEGFHELDQIALGQVVAVPTLSGVALALLIGSLALAGAWRSGRRRELP